MEIPLFLDADLLEQGIWYQIRWAYASMPHLLVTGATGSGKTYAVKLLLGRIANHIPNAQVTICDFKRDDFRFLEGCPRYYSFKGCSEGLESFYKAFEARQQGSDFSRHFRLLCFDEWASYLNFLDKKQMEAERLKMATLLMLGRAYNFHVLVSQQRADAHYFSAARDNFSVVIAMGNISKEAKEMLFHDCKEQMKPVSQIGQGYMLLGGAELKAIQVPTITMPKKLENAIKSLVGKEQE